MSEEDTVAEMERQRAHILYRPQQYASNLLDDNMSSTTTAAASLTGAGVSSLGAGAPSSGTEESSSGIGAPLSETGTLPQKLECRQRQERHLPFHTRMPRLRRPGSNLPRRLGLHRMHRIARPPVLDPIQASRRSPKTPTRNGRWGKTHL